MSVKIMSQVWEDTSLSGSEKLILLSLADHANDEGVCYPSVARLALRTGMSERTIQGALKALCAAGKLKIDRQAGPRGCNMFTAYPPQILHPADIAPPQISRDTPQILRETPADSAPEPSGTVSKPSNKDQSAPDPLFSEFWDRWSLAKVGRKKAEAAFKRLSKANKRLAIDNAKAWIIQWRMKNPLANDIHPTTYLNGQRWHDDFTSQQSDSDPEIARFRKLAGGK